MEKSYVIGISGGSGSGKTTFIDQLKASFTEKEVCIISMDNYYRPREEQLVDSNGVRNFDRPESIDDQALYDDLQLLLSGVEFERKEYTFNNAAATPRMIGYYPAKVLVVEGLFLFHFEKVKQLLDLKVLIDADNVKKLIRRVKRDSTERNYPLDDVLYRYEHHVLPSYNQYIAPYAGEVDIIINNNDHFAAALQMLSGYIASLV